MVLEGSRRMMQPVIASPIGPVFCMPRYPESVVGTNPMS